MGEHAKRVRFVVAWDRRDQQWEVSINGFVEYGTHAKKDAVVYARDMARGMRESEGTPAQLIVKGKNGRIQFEHTYGKDPKKTKG